MPQAKRAPKDLAQIRELLATLPVGRQPFGEIFQLRVVIDTNIVLRDLLWLVQERINPDAVTTILELIISKTLVAYAPTVLEAEVLEKIPVLASDKNISETALHNEWQK